MRGSKVTDWAEALRVPPRDLPEALRRLHRESVTLHEELIHFRQKVHEGPMVHIDQGDGPGRDRSAGGERGDLPRPARGVEGGALT